MIEKLQDETAREIGEVLFPKKPHAKPAKSVAEYMTVEAQGNPSPRVDIGTLQGFVNFLIDEKGYN